MFSGYSLKQYCKNITIIIWKNKRPYHTIAHRHNLKSGSQLIGADRNGSINETADKCLD